MVMSPEWLRFDEEERLRLEQSKGDPARVGASPVLPGKNGWLQDLVERVTEQIATRPPQPQLNNASQRIIANRAPDVAPNYDYGTGLNRTIDPLKALQGFVGNVAAEGPGFLRDPSAALDAPLLPIRTIGQGLEGLGVDTGLQDLSVRNPILQRLGIEAPFNTLRDVGSGINRMAGEAAIPTKPWEIALQALPAAMATSRGGNAMLREFLNLPEDALLDPAIARRFRSLFEGDFLPATAKGFWSGPGGGNPAAREVMQNLDTVAGQDRNRAVEQAYQGRTMDARYSAPQDERGAISQNISEPQPVDAINANNFGESIRQKIDLQDERAVFSKLEGLKADEERLAQELTDLQAGGTPTVKHPSQADWTPEEHAANLRFRMGQLRREGQMYVDSLAERGSLPKGAVFETMKPNTPSLVGPRPPMEEGAQPRIFEPVPVRDEPVKPGTLPGEAAATPEADAERLFPPATESVSGVNGPGGRAPLGEEPMPSSAAPDADADLMQGADESDLEYAVRLRMSGLSKDEIARIEQANKDLASAKIVDYQDKRSRQFERAGRMSKRMDALKADEAANAAGERGRAAQERLAADVASRRAEAARPAPPPGRMPPNPRTAPRAPEGGPRPGGAAQQPQPQQPFARETQAVNDAADAIVNGDDSSRAQAKFVQSVIAHANAQGGATNTLDQQIGSVLAGTRRNKDVRKMLDQVGWSKQRVENLAIILTSGDPSIDTPEKLNRFLRNADKPTFWNKLEYYWKNNVLSGPLTQARNIVGNATTTAYAPVKRGVAGAFEQPLAFIQGRPAERFWQEAPAAVAGALHGFGPGVEAFMKTMRSGISPTAAGKAEITRDPPLKGPIGTAFGLPLRTLSAMDELFGSINYQSMLEADVARKARSEGLRGAALKRRIDDLIANPPDDMIAKAADEADELTFRNDPEGKTAELVDGLMRVRDAFGLPGRLAVAFLKTPANAVKYGITNSPFGLLNIPAWRKALQGNPEGVDELTGAFLGSALAASLAAGLESGVIDITAGMPTNSGERDRWQREGKSPFSIKVPGVGWVEYKSIPALNTTMLTVASVRDALKSGEDPTDKVKQAVANVSSNLYDQAYLNGLTDLMDALRDPIRYGERFATRQVGGFVPFSGAQRQVAQVIDPTKRDPSGPVETLKTGIPGLSSTVRPQRNAFGAEVKQSVPLPVRVSRSAQSALDKELERLDYNVGFVTDKIGTYTLTADEQNEYQALAGSLTEQRLEKLLSGTIYRKSADEAKKKQIRATVDGARAAARAEMIKRARTAAKP